MFLWADYFFNISYDVTKHALSRALSGSFTVQVACLRYLGLRLNDLRDDRQFKAILRAQVHTFSHCTVQYLYST